MRPFWSRKQQVGSTELVGLAPGVRGVGLVHTASDGENGKRLVHAEFARGDDPEACAIAIAGLVKDLGLTGLPCVSVLSPDSYALRLVSRPPVPDAELDDAARWLVQDLVDFDVTQAAISAFEFPEDAARGREPTIYVAAVPPETIRTHTELAEASGLVLQGLELPELALRNLLASLPPAVAGTAFLQLEDKKGLLAICHEQHLYLTRGVSAGAHPFEQALTGPQLHISLDGENETDDEGLPDEAVHLLDQLVLELQRSFDYYESELGKAPVSRLVIAPAACEMTPLLPHIREQFFPVSVELLDLQQVAASDITLPNALQVELVSALGAALRDDTEQQVRLTDAREVQGDDPLSFTNLLRLAAVGVVCLAAAVGLDLWQQRQLNTRLEGVRASMESRLQQIERFRSEFPQPEPSDAYRAQVAALRERARAKARLYEDLRSQSAEATAGFSGGLLALGRNTMKGLWLTRFEMREGGSALTIEGSALEPELVPKLLVELGREPVFDGKRFRVFRIETSSERSDAIDFALHSEAAAEIAP